MPMYILTCLGRPPLWWWLLKTAYVLCIYQVGSGQGLLVGDELVVAQDIVRPREVPLHIRSSFAQV